MAWKQKHVGPKLTVKLKAGGTIYEYKPVFSQDSKSLFVITGTDIHVFSCQSGDRTSVLRGHTRPVVGLQLLPSDSQQLISCSENGELICWSCETGQLLHKKNIRQKKVTGFYVGGETSEVYVVGSTRTSESHLIRAETGHHVIMDITGTMHSVAFSHDMEYVAYIGTKQYPNDSLFIKKLKAGMQVRHLTDERTLTCVVWHPTQFCLATGDISGRVIIWRNILECRNVQKTIYHWHSLPVADVIFSEEGNYFYSAGEECVVVKWKLDDPEARSFVPRLGMPIRHLSLSWDNLLLSASHTDNSISLVSVEKEVAQMIQELARTEKENPVEMCVDPRTSAIILNARPGHLQFYSVHEEKHLFSLDVVHQNYITKERNKVLINTDVEKVAVSAAGTWLVTIDQWDDGKSTPEIWAKFWKFDDEIQTFVLNTKVNQPHGGKVHTIRFQPTERYSQQPLLVSTGDDCRFKIWNLVDSDNIHGNVKNWNCEGVGSYRSFPAGDVAFSEDGSLLAVCFGHVLTLWVPETCELKGTLCHNSLQEKIRRVEIGHGKCCHLVVSVSNRTLSVWNLLSLSLMSTVNLESEMLSLASDPRSEYMALFNSNSCVFIFKPDDPNPVYTHGNLSSAPVITSVFVPSVKSEVSVIPWQKKSQLYFLTAAQELLTLEQDDREASGKDSKEDEAATAANIQTNFPPTPFGALIAQHKKSGVEALEPKKQHLLSSSESLPLKEILSAPSHTLPNMSSLCSSFLVSFLPVVRVKTEEPKVDGAEYETAYQSFAWNTEVPQEVIPVPENKRPDAEPGGSSRYSEEEQKLKCLAEEDYSWLILKEEVQ